MKTEKREFLRSKDDDDDTHCNVNNRNSAISSTNHSGKAENALGMLEGSVTVGESEPFLQSRVFDRNSPTVV